MFVVEFYLKLKLILRTISYLTNICWEIDNFVNKSDIFKRFFICKNILKKISCYHDNYFRWHIVKRGLDWTGKTRTGLRLVKRGLDSISKTRTGLC